MKRHKTHSQAIFA